MRLEGWTNCDYIARPGVTDACFNLQGPWPFADNSTDAALASHVLEHLSNYATFFDELWRVMREGCTAIIRVPFGGSRGAWADPTHVHVWYPESFCHLQPGYGEYVRNLQYAGQQALFNVLLTQVTVAEKFISLVRLPFFWRVFRHCVDHFPNMFAEVVAYLVPLKSLGNIEKFSRERHANIVPLQFVYRHENRLIVLGRPTTWVGWAAGEKETP